MKNALILLCAQFTEELEETLEAIATHATIDETDCFAIITQDEDIIATIEPYAKLFEIVFMKPDGTMRDHRYFARNIENVYDEVFICFPGQHIPEELFEEEE